MLLQLLVVIKTTSYSLDGSDDGLNARDKLLAETKKWGDEDEQC